MADRKLIVQIVGDDSSLTRAFRRSSRNAKHFEGRISGVGLSLKRMAAAAGGALAAVGLTRFAADSIKSAAAFETSMQRIVGLAGGAQESIKGLSDEVLALAPSVGKSPQELAEALYFVASAGIAVADQMEVVTAAAKASASGLGETQTVADAVTSAMNAYGSAVLDAAKATDVLVATVREGKGEAAAFAPVIGTVAAIASQLGVSFNEVGAALASQTRLGVSAETAAIQLQAVFSSLLKGDSVPKAAKALKSVGLNFADLRDQLKQQGLLSVLTTLKGAFGDNAAAMAQAFPNIRALRGLLNLVGKNAEQVRGVFDRMRVSTGALDTAFGAISETTQQRFAELGAALDVIKIQVGAAFAPLAGAVAQGLTKAASAVTEFITKLRELEGFRAKLDFVLEVGRSMVAQAQRVASQIRDSVANALEQVNWREVGASISQGLVSALDAIAAFVRSVDWAKVGGAVVAGIVEFLKGVDWVGLFKSIVQLWVAALKATAKLLVGAGKALLSALLDGIKFGARAALLYIEKWALELVAKIVGVFGFLGRFNPFKGVEEKVNASLVRIQAQIDALHGPPPIIVTVRPERESGALVPKTPGTAGGKPTIEVDVPKAVVNAGDAGKKVANAAKTAFEKTIGKLEIAFDIAGRSKSLKDDLSILKQQEKVITARLKVTKNDLDLQKQLVSVQNQQLQIQKDIAENQRTAAQAKQFKALGLTGEGDKPTPGSGSLLHRARSLQNQIKGTVLDTGRTRTQLAQIVSTLKKYFKTARKDVRAAILAMLNDISGALDDKGKGPLTGPLTKTSGLNSKKILEGLGLSPDQIRELRGRLSSFNSAGMGLAGSQTRGTGRPARESGFFIENNVTVSIDGQKFSAVVTKQQQKTRRRNPRQKRGPNRMTGGV